MPTLDWIGKPAVVNHHREVPTRLLHCDNKLSNGHADAGNIVVQGDNLEGLRALLPFYAGKIKCIYIDPPYNTGGEDWVYSDSVDSPEIRKWLGDTVGKEAEDLTRHDKWLCMMYPRLRLLRDFLKDDGAVFINLDDNEHHTAKFMCDEIFGRGSFIASIVWQKIFAKKNKARISVSHDYILVYAPQGSKWDRKLIPRTSSQMEAYSNPDNDRRGVWQDVSLSVTSESEEKRKEYRFPIKLPSGRVVTPPEGRHWNGLKPRIEQLRSDDRLWFGPNGDNAPRLKVFLEEVQGGIVPDTWWPHTEYGTNQDAKREIKEIFQGEEPFSTPKPVKLIQQIIRIATGPDDLVLDAFAGSGTTGHAVLKQNAEDGGRRKFVLVEMDQGIADRVTRERLKRVVEGYSFKRKTKLTKVKGLGGGFRYCKLGSTLFDEWGAVNSVISFSDLAAFTFFSETGSPIPKKANGSSAYIGTFEDRAIYLLFDPKHIGIGSDVSQNVLTADKLESLPTPKADFVGTRIVYGEGCTVPSERLAVERVVFKQIPYQLTGV